FKLLELIYKAFNRFLTIMSSTRNQSENRIVAAKQLLARIDDLPAVDKLPAITVADGTYLTVNGDTPTPRDIQRGLIKLREVFFTESIDNMEY
ncbi:hypothetical protein MYF61_28920, partial [Klebsiella quasipneumoniae]|uniref:hypothetical protein n=1 Tax=Klebsiella quasipneumoniae TaxID=1463165 RepID=UPI00203493FE